MGGAVSHGARAWWVVVVVVVVVVFGWGFEFEV
jgi:hypothetical protein